MSTHRVDLARVLEETLVSQVAEKTFVDRLNSYVGGRQRLDVVSPSALSELAPYSDLGVELGLREEFSGRCEFFLVRIERGEIILPHSLRRPSSTAAHLTTTAPAQTRSSLRSRPAFPR